MEDVTADLLASAARRVADGTRALFELRLGGRPPTISPGPACGYCRERDACEGATAWAAERAALGLDT